MLWSMVRSRMVLILIMLIHSPFPPKNRADKNVPPTPPRITKNKPRFQTCLLVQQKGNLKLTTQFSGNSGSTPATAPQHRSPAPSTASLGRTAVDRLPTKILPLVNWTLCELFQPPYFTLTPLNIDNKKHMWPDS